MSPADLSDELRAARRAVEQAQSHARTLREQTHGSRAANRLESDVRRVVEDLDDLAAETGATVTGGILGGPHAVVEPVPVPSSPRDESEFQPECDDEGVGGGWHADSHAGGPPRRRRRA